MAQPVTWQCHSGRGLEPEHWSVRQQGKSGAGKRLCERMIISAGSSAAVMLGGGTARKTDEPADTAARAAEHWPAGHLGLGAETQHVGQTEPVGLSACLLPSRRYHAQLRVAQYRAPGSPRNRQSGDAAAWATWVTVAR